ncbi:MAG: DUF1934 domain-containing protein [Oscillospiraceae bacterium]|nr:DUF1934 domain-containing protein [Oscillospiraceae bacterium]
MKDNYLITIDTIQKTDAGDDNFSLSTFGEYDYTSDRTVIRYEDSAATGFEGCETELNISSEGVTMRRTGPSSSHMVLEKGKKHVCHYMTPYGDLPLGVYTEYIKDDLSESGGTLDLRYSLDLNANFFALNHLKITVKEKN